MKDYFLVAVAVWNLTMFLIYAIDKYRAKSGGWRIRERTLIIGAICFGGLGAAAGMFMLRHKIRHLKFRVIIPLAMLMTIAGIVFVYVLA